MCAQEQAQTGENQITQRWGAYSPPLPASSVSEPGRDAARETRRLHTSLCDQPIEAKHGVRVR